MPARARIITFYGRDRLVLGAGSCFFAKTKRRNKRSEKNSIGRVEIFVKEETLEKALLNIRP